MKRKGALASCCTGRMEAASTGGKSRPDCNDPAFCLKVYSGIGASTYPIPPIDLTIRILFLTMISVSSSARFPGW
jgi:hypothetical protein